MAKWYIGKGIYYTLPKRKRKRWYKNENGGE